MLVLKRNVGQSVCVTTPAGEKVWIKVVTAKDRTMRLGIFAPKPFKIERHGAPQEQPAPVLTFRPAALRTPRMTGA